MSDIKVENLRDAYSEIKQENFGTKKFDYILVFGHSPIKALLLEEELSPLQKQKWEEFTKNPLQGNKPGHEPDFRVLTGVFAEELREIQRKNDIDEKTKSALLVAKRIELEHNGRLVLNRISRVNALGAGLALYLGITDKLIISGAGTIPRKVAGDKVELPEGVFENAPSEAEMMRDIIVRTFGRLMFDRDVSLSDLSQKYYQQYYFPIDQKTAHFQDFLEREYNEYKNNELLKNIEIEGKSVNTLENFGEILKMHPDLKHAATVAPEYHLARLKTLARMHSVEIEPFGSIKDVDLLKARAKKLNKKAYLEILDYMDDPLSNPDLADRMIGDNKWHRALLEPSRLGYWIGYITELDINRLQSVLNMLNNPAYRDSAQKVFAEAGLQFDEYVNLNLTEISEAKIQELRTKLKEAYHGKGKPLREKAVAGLS